MIRLTETQAEVYEFLKTGEYSLNGIASGTGKSKNTIGTILIFFQRTGIAVRKGKDKKYTYTASPIEYFIGNYNGPNGRHDDTELDPNDRLLNEMVNVRLTPDQIIYLKRYKKKETRTELAKKLGISKLQLCYYLTNHERLG